jgi:hypothetical protein
MSPRLKPRAMSEKQFIKELYINIANGSTVGDKDW